MKERPAILQQRLHRAVNPPDELQESLVVSAIQRFVPRIDSNDLLHHVACKGLHGAWGCPDVGIQSLMKGRVFLLIAVMMPMPLQQVDTFRTVHHGNIGVYLLQSLAPRIFKAEAAHLKVAFALPQVHHDRGGRCICFRASARGYQRIHREIFAHDLLQEKALGLNGYRQYPLAHPGSLFRAISASQEQ